MEPTLPPNCHLRPAQARDRWPIRWLVLKAALDPTQLRWQQFWVIEAGDQVVGCGQLRQLQNAQELGSLVVQKAWRGQGLGRVLAQHLIQSATQPLYVECLGQWRRNWFMSLGFVDVNPATQNLPKKFRNTLRISQLIKLPLFIMHRPNTLH